jgi:hypothetical protein
MWTGDDPTSSQGPAQRRPQPQQQQHQRAPRRGNTDPIPRRDHVKTEPDTDTDIAQEQDPYPGYRQTANGQWFPKRKPGDRRRGKPREPREPQVPNSREEPREPGGSGW